MKVVDEALLDVFRGRPCEWCGKPPPSDPHHIEAKGMDAGKRLDVALNLLSACRWCHNALDTPEMKRRCFEKVAAREGLESGTVAQEAIWRLLRKPKP